MAFEATLKLEKLRNLKQNAEELPNVNLVAECTALQSNGIQTCNVERLQRNANYNIAVNSGTETDTCAQHIMCCEVYTNVVSDKKDRAFCGDASGSVCSTGSGEWNVDATEMRNDTSSHNGETQIKFHSKTSSDDLRFTGKEDRLHHSEPLNRNCTETTLKSQVTMSEPCNGLATESKGGIHSIEGTMGQSCHINQGAKLRTENASKKEVTHPSETSNADCSNIQPSIHATLVGFCFSNEQPKLVMNVATRNATDAECVSLAAVDLSNPIPLRNFVHAIQDVSAPSISTPTTAASTTASKNRDSTNTFSYPVPKVDETFSELDPPRVLVDNSWSRNRNTADAQQVVQWKSNEQNSCDQKQIVPVSQMSYVNTEVMESQLSLETCSEDRSNTSTTLEHYARNDFAVKTAGDDVKTGYSNKDGATWQEEFMIGEKEHHIGQSSQSKDILVGQKVELIGGPGVSPSLVCNNAGNDQASIADVPEHVLDKEIADEAEPLISPNHCPVSFQESDHEGAAGSMKWRKGEIIQGQDYGNMELDLSVEKIRKVLKNVEENSPMTIITIIDLQQDEHHEQEAKTIELKTIQFNSATLNGRFKLLKQPNDDGCYSETVEPPTNQEPSPKAELQLSGYNEIHKRTDLNDTGQALTISSGKSVNLRHSTYLNMHFWKTPAGSLWICPENDSLVYHVCRANIDEVTYIFGHAAANIIENQGINDLPNSVLDNIEAIPLLNVHDMDEDVPALALNECKVEQVNFDGSIEKEVKS